LLRGLDQPSTTEADFFAVFRCRALFLTLFLQETESDGTRDYSKNALPGQTLAPQTAAFGGD
jgi:hypothetical protein